MHKHDTQWACRRLGDMTNGRRALTVYKDDQNQKHIILTNSSNIVKLSKQDIIWINVIIEYVHYNTHSRLNRPTHHGNAIH